MKCFATGAILWPSSQSSMESRATGKTCLSLPLQSRSNLSHCHQMPIHSTLAWLFLGSGKGAIVVIIGGSVSILDSPPPHGFLNSDRQVSEVFAADRKSSVKAPQQGANRRSWVGMLAPDPPVTASQFVAGVFSLALFFSRCIHSFRGKIRFMASRKEKLLVGSALVYLALLLPARSRWGEDDLGENVDYCCNRYCCCQLTCGRTGRMRNQGVGGGLAVEQNPVEPVGIASRRGGPVLFLILFSVLFACLCFVPFPRVSASIIVTYWCSFSWSIAAPWWNIHLHQHRAPYSPLP